MNVNLFCISLNARGLRDIVKRKSIFLFCKGEKANIILLQETHSQQEDEKFWVNQWGDKILFDHGSTKSAGVAILFCNSPGKLVASKSSSNGHWLICVLDIDDQYCIVVNIYGFNNPTQNKLLLTELSNNITNLKLTYPSANIIVGGDFNMVYDEHLDRFPSKCQHSSHNSTLSNFCGNHNLVDPWRLANPDFKQYSWFKPNNTLKSRIDFWLISASVISHVSECCMSAAPLSDHSVIKLKFAPPGGGLRNKGYWKFNSALLTSQTYCDGIKSLITEVMADNTIVSYVSKWEFLKFKFREFSIHFGKSFHKNNKLAELNLIKEINMYCNKASPNESDKQKLLTLQGKLDKMYLKKAEGAYIRSRAKWIEDGEKSTAYFCQLERRRQERNSIKTLLIQNQICTDPALITKELTSFYSKLYSAAFSETDSNLFFDHIKNFIPSIDDDFAELCDADITMLELDNAVKNLSLNKSPGCDGLTSNFYRHFWDLLKNPFILMLTEATDTLYFPPTMKQGLITLIPKPGKDSKIIDNLRPITLLNTDYKIVTLAYANRLKSKLNSIISDSQSGFMKGRSIHNNIRLVMDLLDYSNLIDDDGFILFLDFYKAFDSIEHPFIFQCLKQLGFKNKFCATIESLYDNANSSISLPNGTSPRFDIKRGVKQGCPISPFLFIIATEMLSIFIKNSDIAPLNVMGLPVIISQLADDTTIFMKHLTETPKIIEALNMFSQASGLTLNLRKCELMPIHQSDLTEAYNIPIRSTVKYLGIHISKDLTDRENLNIWRTIAECQTKLNSWLLRDISLLGRVFLTKMESISRCIYPAYSMTIPNRAIKKINQINFDYIWRKKMHYIKRAEMTKEYKDGGLQGIDFEIMDGTLKINWLKSFFNNKSFWYHIPREIFKKFGGIELLLKCDFNIKKLPIKLSRFHQQVLLYWKLLYNHNFTPHNTPIWNNRYITIKNKSLYKKDWMDKGIWSLIHLTEKDGRVMTHENFCHKYNITVDQNSFASIIRAIPVPTLNLIQEIVSNSHSVSPTLPHLVVGNFDFKSVKISNKTIIKMLDDTSHPSLPFRNSIKQIFSIDIIYSLRSKYLKFPITPKAKEVHFRVLNDVYPSGEFLRQRCGFDTNKCAFCDDIETSVHLFFQCIYSEALWNDIHDWLYTKIRIEPFSENDVIYGAILDNTEWDFLVNNIIIVAKFYIHKCRYGKVKPRFYAFHNECLSFSKALNLMKSKHAMKLFNLFEKYDLKTKP
uniref:Reverse transcriptase domain-containing protein n=1 Tax=Nothobranchius korthausae TaxID=1143690 RepID=A0A1A8EWE2_9TELE